MKKFAVIFTECLGAKRRHGKNIWTEYFDTEQDALKALEECNSKTHEGDYSLTAEMKNTLQKL